MINKKKFDHVMINGTLGKLVNWMSGHVRSRRILFIFLGIISTIWFLLRVIPKPSRATYPCMRVAAPFMSGLIIYLLAVFGSTVAARKFKRKLINVRHISTVLLIFGVIVTMAVTPSSNTNSFFQEDQVKRGHDDGPNQPVGEPMGVNPGRVIWVWNPEATNENCTTYWFSPENYDQGVISRMFSESMEKLSGKNTVSKSWDAMFRYFNNKKNHVNKGYTRGEKIFIKINQTSGRGRLNKASRSQGNYYYPSSPSEELKKRIGLGVLETGPSIILEILRQLVNECGINQSDIAIGDPQNPVYGHNYDAWSAEFPNVLYVDNMFGTHGRTLIHPTENDLVFYSDKTQSDKLYDIIENADYLINVANLKPHLRAGISLTAKNHFGSQSRPGAYHLHYSGVSPLVEAKPTNTGYHKYRVMVDLMGSRYLGQNTLLYVVDGLYGGGASEGGPPVKYFMAPFNNDWSNSIFISEDQVALESVCYDFLRNEWNGTYSHDPSNNRIEIMPDVNGVDDYLHQAADKANWPVGISYDPDNSGKPLSSLGVHEHWNSPEDKQYSRNLGKAYGIELISIPSTLVKNGVSGTSSKTNRRNRVNMTSGSPANVSAPPGKGTTTQDKSLKATTVENTSNSGNVYKKPAEKITVIGRAFDSELKAKNFHSIVNDADNTKWFLTESGIVSFDGKNWVLHNKNRKIPTENLKNLVYDLSSYGKELWIATTQGATVASLPVDASTGATTYYTENSSILSDTVLAIAIGKSPLRWFGTMKGVSAFNESKWLPGSYQRLYPEGMFKDFPITALATTPGGDSLYVATAGAGVSRFFRNKVDAISGASQYARWGPIDMPSDIVLSLCITQDGTQWLGTDKGVARHIGSKTLEDWTVFNTENGLIDNFVQAIASDKMGKMWFGTKGGVSSFDGSSWTSLTMTDGLSSNNILCIMVDKNNIVWMGSDNGVMSYNNGELVLYH